MSEGLSRFTCQPGRLVWNQFRDAVKELKWRGHRIELIESSGWLVRDFRFVGDETAIQRIATLVREINDEAHAREMAARM